MRCWKLFLEPRNATVETGGGGTVGGREFFLVASPRCIVIQLFIDSGVFVDAYVFFNELSEHSTGDGEQLFDILDGVGRGSGLVG